MKRLLLAIAAIAGAIVVSKALTGYPAGSPINAEGIFAIAFVALVLTHLRTTEDQPIVGEFRTIPLVAGLLIVAAAFWGVQNMSFLCDDYFVVLDAVRGRGAHFIDTLLSDKGDVYFRPAAYSTLWLTAKALGTDPRLWHLHHLALHLVNCALLYLVALRLGLTAAAASLALVLFGVHGARPESVVWIAGYWELVSVAFVLATIIFVLQNNRLALLCCLAALWSKESAYVLPALIFLLPGNSRIKRAVPFAVITAIAFIHRWIALGGIGGYVTGTGHPEAGAISALRVGKLLFFRLWASLIFPINWSIPPEPVLAIALALALAGLLLAAHSKLNRNLTLFCLGATLAAALPASTQLLIGPDLQKGRLLYLPSIGLCILIAALLQSIPQARLRLASSLACITFSLVTLRHNLNIWQDVSKVMKTTYAQAGQLTKDGPRTVTAIGIPGSINGVYFFMNGFTAALDMANGGYYETEVLPADSTPPPAMDRTILLWKNESLQKLYD